MGKYSAKKRNGSKKQSFKKRKYNKKTGGMWPFTGQTENPPNENVVEEEASVINTETAKPETVKSETDTNPEINKKPETTQNTSAAQKLENELVNALVKANNPDEVIQILNEYLEKVEVVNVN